MHPQVLLLLLLLLLLIILRLRLWDCLHSPLLMRDSRITRR
jgi:hypothetical protein